MASIKDVAYEAGVSTATVSRVLAGKSNVSEKARTRVFGAVDKLDYRPNRAAQTLRLQRSATIGLLVSDIRNPFFTAVSRAVEDVAHEAGYSVFLCNTDEDPAKEAMYLKLMIDQDVAGVIYSPTLQSAEKLDATQFRFPIILIDRDAPQTDVDAVLLDNVAAGEQLACHLLQNGYRRIFGLFGQESGTGHKRRAGLLRALHSADVPPFGETFTDARIEAGYEAVLTALQSADPPDAIFTTNSLLAAGAMRAIHEQSLKIPDDIALAGFDDATWTTLVQPQITLIAQPTYEIGQSATELLIKRIEQPQRSARRVILSGKLLARGSTQKLV